MNYLLDTCAVSEGVKPRPNPGWQSWIESSAESSLFLSVISAAEIQFGVFRLPPGERREFLQRWWETIPDRFAGRVLGVEFETARTWAVIASERARAGRPIAPLDAMIAATARAHGLTLVTRNTGDFAGAGLVLLNPWSGA